MSRQIVVPFFLMRCFPRVSGDEPRARWPRGSSHVFSPRERG